MSDLNSDHDADLAFQQLESELLAYTNGRLHATTTEYAQLIGKAKQTILKNYCLTGDAFGVVPIKVGNRLLFPIKRIAQLLTAGDAK